MLANWPNRREIMAEGFLGGLVVLLSIATIASFFWVIHNSADDGVKPGRAVLFIISLLFTSGLIGQCRENAKAEKHKEVYCQECPACPEPEPCNKTDDTAFALDSDPINW